MHLINRDGVRKSFRSKQHALNELGYYWIQANVSRDFSGFTISNGILRYESRNYIMRDDEDQALTEEDFYHLVQNRRPTWNGEGPVPGIHKARYSHSHRRPKIASECRARFAMDELEPAMRAKRATLGKVNGWGSLRSDWDQKSWKRYRKHQWK